MPLYCKTEKISVLLFLLFMLSESGLEWPVFQKDVSSITLNNNQIRLVS